MASRYNLPSPLGKRSAQDLERDRDEVLKAMRSAKRRQIEIDVDGNYYETEDAVSTRRFGGNGPLALISDEHTSSMSDNDPKNWPLERLQEHFEREDWSFLSQPEMESANPGTEAVDEDMQLVSGKDQIGQAAVQAGPHTTQHHGPSEGNETFQPASSYGGQSEQTRSEYMPQEESTQPVSYERRSTPPPVFPSADTPLRDDIPLAKICEYWPHHLDGHNLRRFILADWTAGRIFVNMHSYARDAHTKEASLSMRKGWEIIEKRLVDEKRKMDEEERARQAQPAVSETPAPVAQPFLPLSGHRQWFDAQPSPTSSMDGSTHAQFRATGVPLSSKFPIAQSPQHVQANASNQPRPTASPTSAEDHVAQCQTELETHTRLLNLLFSGPLWDQSLPAEREERVRNEWITRARKCERGIIDGFHVNVSGIDFQSSSKGDMLIRMAELIRRHLFTTTPVPPNASVQELNGYQEAVAEGIKCRQLAALRHWTTEWEQEVAHHQTAVSSGAHSALHQAESHDPRAMSQVQPQHPGTIVHGFLPPNPSSEAAMTDWTSQDNLIASLFSKMAQEGSSYDRVQPNPPNTPSEIASTPLSASFASQSLTSHANDNSDGPSNALALSYSRNPYLNMNPGPIVGNIPPNVYQGPPTLGSRHSGTLTKTPTKRRGRGRGQPRTRMFITKPPSNAPLSALAQTNDEEVLREFPEHLSVPAVMARFIKSDDRFGGWPTGTMVDCLMVHPNAKDFQGITPEARRANVKRWVTKERDSSNKWQRREAGIPPRSSRDHNPPETVPQMPLTSALPSSTSAADPSVQPSYVAPYSVGATILQVPGVSTSDIIDPMTPTHWPVNTPIGNVMTAPSILDPAGNVVPTPSILDPARNFIPAPEILDPNLYFNMEGIELELLQTTAEGAMPDIPPVAGRDWDEEFRTMEGFNF